MQSASASSPDPELLKNAVEQAMLLLARDRFEDDPEVKVVAAVLRGALESRWHPEWEPVVMLRDGVLEEQLAAAREEIAFLRGVIQALVERKGPVRIG